MAEIVGLAASIIQIAGAGVKLSSVLYNYVNSVNRADKDIADIAGDVQLTANTLDTVGLIFQAEDAKTVVTKKAMQDANTIIQKREVVFGELQRIVDKRSKVFKDGKKGLTAFGKLAWPMKEEKVELCRRKLESSKSSLLLLLGVIQLGQAQATGKLERSSLEAEREKIRELYQRQQDSLESLRALEKSLSNVTLEDDETTLAGSSAPSRVNTISLMAVPTPNNSQEGLGKMDKSKIDTDSAALMLTDDSESSDGGDTASDEEDEGVTAEELAKCAKHVQRLLKRIKILQKTFESPKTTRQSSKRRVHKLYRRFCNKFECDMGPLIEAMPKKGKTHADQNLGLQQKELPDDLEFAASSAIGLEMGEVNMHQLDFDEEEVDLGIISDDLDLDMGCEIELPESIEAGRGVGSSNQMRGSPFARAQGSSDTQRDEKEYPPTMSAFIPVGDIPHIDPFSNPTYYVAMSSTRGSYQPNDATSDRPGYSGDGYGEEWIGMRHHHPTRLSDVPEEDQRSRTSPSRAPEFAVPGSYMSPLTSPALHTQDAIEARDANRKTEEPKADVEVEYGMHLTPFMLCLDTNEQTNEKSDQDAFSADNENQNTNDTQQDLLIQLQQAQNRAQEQYQSRVEAQAKAQAEVVQRAESKSQLDLDNQTSSGPIAESEQKATAFKAKTMKRKNVKGLALSSPKPKTTTNPASEYPVFVSESNTTNFRTGTSSRPVMQSDPSTAHRQNAIIAPLPTQTIVQSRTADQSINDHDKNSVVNSLGHGSEQPENLGLPATATMNPMLADWIRLNPNIGPSQPILEENPQDFNSTLGGQLQTSPVDFATNVSQAKVNSPMTQEQVQPTTSRCVTDPSIFRRSTPPSRRRPSHHDNKKEEHVLSEEEPQYQIGSVVAAKDDNRLRRALSTFPKGQDRRENTHGIRHVQEGQFSSPGPETNAKRPLQQQEITTPIGRLLQPRPPPHSYPGEFRSGGPAYTYPISPVGEPHHKKKRGRPTKAEAQQRAQEAAARGEVYPPPRMSRASVVAPPPPESRPLAQTPPGSVPQAPGIPPLSSPELNQTPEIPPHVSFGLDETSLDLASWKQSPEGDDRLSDHFRESMDEEPEEPGEPEMPEEYVHPDEYSPGEPEFEDSDPRRQKRYRMRPLEIETVDTELSAPCTNQPPISTSGMAMAHHSAACPPRYFPGNSYAMMPPLRKRIVVSGPRPMFSKSLPPSRSSPDGIRNIFVPSGSGNRAGNGSEAGQTPPTNHSASSDYPKPQYSLQRTISMVNLHEEPTWYKRGRASPAASPVSPRKSRSVTPTTTNSNNNNNPWSNAMASAGSVDSAKSAEDLARQHPEHKASASPFLSAGHGAYIVSPEDENASVYEHVGKKKKRKRGRKTDDQEELDVGRRGKRKRGTEDQEEGDAERRRRLYFSRAKKIVNRAPVPDNDDMMGSSVQHKASGVSGHDDAEIGQERDIVDVLLEQWTVSVH